MPPGLVLVVAYTERSNLEPTRSGHGPERVLVYGVPTPLVVERFAPWTQRANPWFGGMSLPRMTKAGTGAICQAS